MTHFDGKPAHDNAFIFVEGKSGSDPKAQVRALAGQCWQEAFAVVVPSKACNTFDPFASDRRTSLVNSWWRTPA
jgi:hypothetical protein